MKKKNIDSKKQPSAEKKPLTEKAYLHFFLAIIFPGLGHLLLGKKKRALAFAVSILLLFIAGLAMNGHLHRFVRRPDWLGVRPDWLGALVVLVWLGNFLLDKKKRSLTFAVSILLLFIFGIMAMSYYLHIFGEMPGWLPVLAVLGCMSAGLPYFIALIFGLGTGDPTSIMEPYANYFIIAAGLLNILIALDAMDIAAGRKD
jgi:hypothetical protein